MEISADNATSYFAIVKSLTQNDGDWDSLNADGNRLCGATEANNFEVTSVNQNGITLVNSQKSFQIPEGAYKLIVNEEMNLLKVEGELPLTIVDMFMIGSFNQWNKDTKVAMELVDGKYVHTMEMGTGNDSEFKLMDANGTWYGAQSEGNFLITQGMVDNPDAYITILKDGGNNMYFDQAGEYTFTFDPYESRLYVTSKQVTPGDINGDGTVDVADVNICINVIMGSNDDPVARELADINGDGTVDISDVNAIINNILTD